MGMSKTVTVSDEVYERLEREKGDRSFSEIIVDYLDARGNLTDVSGANVLDPDVIARTRDEIEHLGATTMDRMSDHEDSE